MPAGFEKCVKEGGRVRTIKLKGGRYMRICYLNGKSHAGEVRKAKEKKQMNKDGLTTKELSSKISKQEGALLKVLREIGYGQVVIYLEAGQPVRIEKIKESIKL